MSETARRSSKTISVAWRSARVSTMVWANAVLSAASSTDTGSGASGASASGMVGMDDIHLLWKWLLESYYSIARAVSQSRCWMAYYVVRVAYLDTEYALRNSGLP